MPVLTEIHLKTTLQLNTVSSVQPHTLNKSEASCSATLEY